MRERDQLFSIRILGRPGINVRIGDVMNGFVAEKDCQTASEAAEFLDRAAREHFPESAYALGKQEWERRNQSRKDRHLKN